MKYYVFEKEHTAEGWYRELIDDCAPSIGTYTKDICHTFWAGEVFVVESSDRNVHEIESTYGASLYGSSAYVRLTISDLLADGTLKEITEEYAKKIRAYQNAGCEYQNALYELELMEQYWEDDEVASFEYFDTLTERISDVIKAQGRMIRCKLAL